MVTALKPLRVDDRNTVDSYAMLLGLWDRAAFPAYVLACHQCQKVTRVIVICRECPDKAFCSLQCLADHVHAEHAKLPRPSQPPDVSER